jgi:hypothetical protein
MQELMTFEALARQVGMNRVRLRTLCIKAGITIRWGGNDKHPQLRARLSEVEKVILSMRHPAPGPKRRKTPKPVTPAGKLHPLIRY